MYKIFVENIYICITKIHIMHTRKKNLKHLDVYWMYLIRYVKNVRGIKSKQMRALGQIR